MSIREYFDTMIHAASFDEMEGIWELQEERYELYEDDFDAFVIWATEQGIDLSVMTSIEGVSELLAWAWDMCGE